MPLRYSLSTRLTHPRRAAAAPASRHRRSVLLTAVLAIAGSAAGAAELRTAAAPYPTPAVVWSLATTPVGLSRLTSPSWPTPWPDALRLVVVDGRTGAILDRPAEAAAAVGPDGVMRLTQALSRPGLQADHEVITRDGALFWQVVFTNRGEDEAWIEVAWQTAPGGLQSPRFYDGATLHATIAKSPARETIDETFPASAVFDRDRGLAIGVRPDALISHLFTRIDADGLWHYGTRLALLPGEAAGVTFVLFAFAPISGHLDAIHGYQQRFPEAFDNPQDIDPRLSRLGTDTLGYGRYRAANATPADERVRAAKIRAAYGSWDWGYAPFRRVGDWLGRPELWDWPMDERERADIAKRATSSWFDLEDAGRFRSTRAEGWRALDHRYNTVLVYYLINWIEENLARDLDAEAQIYPYGQAGTRLSWVTSTSAERHVFPWASPLEETLRRDLPELIRELGLHGFGLDVASNASRFRGTLQRSLPGWAYDDKGRYLHTGIGHRLLLDYLRGFHHDGFRLGVVGNGGDPFMVAAALDAFLNEAKDQPNLRYGEFQHRRHLLGSKRLHLHAGGGFDNPALQIDWQAMTPEQIRLFYQDHLDAWLLGCWQGGFVPGVMHVFGRESITRAMPALIDVQGRGYRSVAACRGDARLSRARYGQGLQAVLAISNPLPERLSAEETILAPYLATGSVLPIAWDGRPVAFAIDGAATHIDLTWERRQTHLLAVPVCLEATDGAPLRLSGRSSAAVRADRQEWRFELRSAAPQRLRWSWSAPPEFEAAAATLDGRPVDPAGVLELPAGDSVLALACQSRLFRSPSEALLAFPYAAAGLVLAATASPREQAAARMIQDAIAFHEQADLAIAETAPGPSIVLSSGADTGIRLDPAGPRLSIAGATPFDTQQLAGRLLRLLQEEKYRSVHPFAETIPLQPTRAMLAKIGVDGKGFFPQIDTAGKDVPLPMPEARIEGVGVVRAALARREHGAPLEAGFMQDDLICAWAVKGSTLKDWRSLSLYINADGRETGRAGVAAGADWVLSARFDQPGLKLTRYRDIPADADGRIIAANTRTASVPHYEGCVVRAGDVLYLLVRRDLLAALAPTPEHRFYVLAYTRDDAMMRGTYTARPEEVRLVRPVLNLAPPAPPETTLALPRLAVPTLTGPLAVDGRLDEALWERAAAIEAFAPLRGDRLKEPTEACAFFTADALVIGFRCWESQTSFEKARAHPHDDDRIWTGAEHVEIFLAPGQPPEATEYAFYQFMTTPAGSQWDGHAMSKNWNGTWEAAAQATPQGWTAEVRIPLAGLDGAAAARTWRVNLARFRGLNREWSTWAPVRGGLQKPAGFGVWEVVPAPAGGAAP
ncbi:MAG: hypothetical protein GX595_05890 [Lentisphaerae bacterium]|nr:hypothetical protein [Lentisphaerota bacterium]